METGPRFKVSSEDWKSGGSNQQPQDCKTSTPTTAPRSFLVFMDTYGKLSLNYHQIPSFSVLLNSRVDAREEAKLDVDRCQDRLKFKLLYYAMLKQG